MDNKNSLEFFSTLGKKVSGEKNILEKSIKLLPQNLCEILFIFCWKLNKFIKLNSYFSSYAFCISNQKAKELIVFAFFARNREGGLKT